VVDFVKWVNSCMCELTNGIEGGRRGGTVGSEEIVVVTGATFCWEVRMASMASWVWGETLVLSVTRRPRNWNPFTEQMSFFATLSPLPTLMITRLASVDSNARSMSSSYLALTLTTDAHCFAVAGGSLDVLWQKACTNGFGVMMNG
jgi:hypothetical protein